MMQTSRASYLRKRNQLTLGSEPGRSDYRTLIDWRSLLELKTIQGIVLALADANELRTRPRMM